MAAKKIMKANKLAPKILLYGNSILMESLTSKLRHVLGWEVSQATGGAVDDIGGVDFIVTDLSDLTAASALPMLCALPGVVLVGVDAIANTLTVLTGRSYPARGVQEVLEAIKEAM
jgi:hypothetical protein